MTVCHHAVRSRFGSAVNTTMRSIVTPGGSPSVTAGAVPKPAGASREARVDRGAAYSRARVRGFAGRPQLLRGRHAPAIPCVSGSPGGRMPAPPLAWLDAAGHSPGTTYATAKSLVRPSQRLPNLAVDYA